jgi:small conductance mechanosensitive channel
MSYWISIVAGQASRVDSLITIDGARDALTLITAKVEGWLESGIRLLPNLAVALLVLAVFWGIARIISTAVDRGLRHTVLHAPLRGLLRTTAYLAILVTGVFVALGIVGLDKTVTSLLAGVGILGLAFGIAFQDIAANFFAGIFISLRHPYEVGELIESNGYLGVVTDIRLRVTIVRLFTGQTVRIPNREVLTNPIVNYTETGERRVDVAVGVSYGSDLEHVRRVTIAAIEPLEARLAARPVELFYEGFGDSSINFQLRFWLDMPRQPEYLAARSEAIMAIKRAYDREGIVIPFPIRTLDFGIKGGQTITEALEPVLAR